MHDPDPTVESPGGAIAAASASLPSRPAMTTAEERLDAALAVSAGGLLYARAAAPRIDLHERNPCCFIIGTAWHEFSGDLSKGIVLQALRGADGRPGTPICHSGNLVAFRLHGRTVSLDMEERIVDFGMQRLPGRVVLFHESRFEAATGWPLPGRVRPVLRLRYEYAIDAASPVVQLTVTCMPEVKARLARLHLTTALDALGGEDGAVRRLVAWGPEGRRVTTPGAASGPHRLHTGPATDLALPDDTRTESAGTMHLRLLDGNRLDTVVARTLPDCALHWVLLRYAADRAQRPEAPIVIREERLLLAADAPNPMGAGSASAEMVATIFAAQACAPAPTESKTAAREPVDAAMAASVLPAARPAPIFLGDRVLTHTHSGARIYAVPNDSDITPWLIEQGIWELHVERTIRRLLRPGMVAADVGANVGYHTLAMADAVGDTGRIFAFEADPFLAGLVEASIAANGLTSRVQVSACAVLDQPGEVVLAAAPGHLGSGHVVSPGDTAPPDDGHYSRRRVVPAVTLDAALAQVPALDLLRMDIEGAEPLALYGASAIIDRSPKLAIVTEWSVAMMPRLSDPTAAVAWLTARGFRFWQIGATTIDPVPAGALTSLPHCDLLIARDDPF